MAEYPYRLHLASPGGGELRDVTQLVQSITWSGSLRQTARRTGGRYPPEGPLGLMPFLGCTATYTKTPGTQAD